MSWCSYLVRSAARLSRKVSYSYEMSNHLGKTPLRITSFSMSKMKCASNKTTRNMYVMNGLIHSGVNFRHLKSSQKCTAKWLLQNTEITVKHSVHNSPPSFDKEKWHRHDKNLEIRPLFSLSVCVYVCLVAHMACSNKIMKFHIEEPIEKSLFKTFYVHTP